MSGQQFAEEVQSVSSETSDEDYCDDEPEEDKNNLKKAEKPFSADNVHPQQLNSPAPAVVLGGENEFFKVSHLGSIEVKEVAKKQPSVSRARVLPLVVNHCRTSSGSEPHDEEAAKEEVSSFQRSFASAPESDSSGPMEGIEKSPYEVDYDAEKGEKIFNEMKEALEEDKHTYGKPTLRALEMFGSQDANRVIRAKPIIDKSGIVFSQGWAVGNFRGTHVGVIPADQLVMCLCTNRFVKASDLELSGICRDLKLYTIIAEAIDKWELEDDFNLVRECTKNYAFTAKKRDSFKCAIFVARLYSCFKNSGRTKLNSRLLNKAKACLTIMENHMPENSSPNKKKKKPADNEMPASRDSSPWTIPGATAAASGAAPAPEQPDPPKRKRGRPPKNPKPSPPSASPLSSSTAPVVCEMKKRKSEKEKATSSTKEERAPAHVRQESNSGEDKTHADPSMQRLISRFEEKYEELGDILQQIKVAARRPPARTEEQIRADVLEEIQRSVMKSFPKK